MNQIVELQNDEPQLMRLCAQRQLYSLAKIVFVVHVCLSGPLTVAFAFSAIQWPVLKEPAILWGIVVTILDFVLLTPLQGHWRKSGASVQEDFDCTVLKLPWNDVKSGRRPEPELIKEQADAYRKRKRMPPVTNWYSSAVAKLPLAQARILCQRTNLFWDSKLRRKYAAAIVGLLVVIVFAAVWFSIGRSKTIEAFLITVIAPLLPLIVLGGRQAREHFGTASRLDQLRTNADGLWTKALSNLAVDELEKASRALQDEILENRRKAPLVFDSIYKALQAKYQEQADFSVEEHVSAWEKQQSV